MANYGYGFGSSQSQGYSTVHPQSSYTAQASSGYGSAYGGTTAPRQMVQQGYDASAAGYGYGYGRQQNNQTSVIPSSHQSTYGTSSYMSRDAGGYDASKSSYGFGSGSQGSYMYGNQGMKQTGSYGGGSMFASGQYGSGQSKQPPNQSFMSQAGSSTAAYVGYGSVRSQAGASVGYSTSSQVVSGGGYSSVSSQASSANNAQQKPRQPQQQQAQQQQQPNPQSSNTYDSVILNAATSFLSQQGQQQKPPWQRQQKPQFRLQNERRQGPRTPQQLHYCEVCKISCAGPMTYKEHLEGQKHKKRAASQVTTTKETLPTGSYKCELCDITCTGIDAYDAHLKGARHVKTVKLHQKLGKPIPETKTPEQITAEEKKANSEAPKKVIQRPTAKPTTAPKINFVGGTKLVSTGAGSKETESTEVKAEVVTEEEDASMDTPDPSEEIVGEEYIEDVKSDVGKVIGYKCTLCDCRFNDVVARTAHVKGRRHRLNYKKKVKPSLRVDMKGSRRPLPLGRMQRIGGSDGRRMREQEMLWRARQQEQLKWEQELRMREEELRRWEEEEYLRRVDEDRYWTRPDRNMHELEHYELERRARYFDSPGGRGDGPVQMTPDDKLVMAKHNNIYPNEEELKQVQNIVGTTEKALKLVSDEIADEDHKAKEKEIKVEVKKEESEETVEVKKEEEAEEGSKAEEVKQEVKKQPPKTSLPRTLKGVMRVGNLAKGLLLHDNLDVDLVVLCNDKPTLSLLRRVGEKLPEKIQQASEEIFDVVVNESHGSIEVSTQSEPKCVVNIKLTSPVMRDEKDDEAEKATSADGDVLNKEKCLEALASLRHAKWFQARANGVQFCVIIIRIMRDLCSRIPAFQVLNGWAIELLVEKALSSGPCPGGPGEALRRVLEVISSGIFLPGSCGILDPCEKEKKDAVGELIDQEREDITAGAQHALRLHAFRQLHTVLDIDPLKVTQRGRGNSRQKRRRDDSREKNAGAKVQKKDDEKPETAAAQES